MSPVAMTGSEIAVDVDRKTLGEPMTFQILLKDLIAVVKHVRDRFSNQIVLRSEMGIEATVRQPGFSMRAATLILFGPYLRIAYAAFRTTFSRVRRLCPGS